MEQINKQRLFNASCVALVVTAMTFAIRAGIMGELSDEFGFTNQQLGLMSTMAFVGFPVSMIIGGLFYPVIGPKKMMYAAFAFHLIGLVLTIVANSFVPLLVSTFFIGLANGAVEAACNPLVADMYTRNRTTMLNKFHVWFPGGIVIGSLIAFVMGEMNMTWQAQIGVMIIPTIVYGWMFFGQKFPLTDNIVPNIKENMAAMADWLFIFMLLCMCLTATTELGTNQFVERILGSAGVHPLIILAMISGIMALGRYYAGPIIHKFNPTGVLFFSAIVATIALGVLSVATGPMVYVGAILFALGVMYFWPTMIGFVSEYNHKTGALGMSVTGGVGMLFTGISLPKIGEILDREKLYAMNNGATEQAAELVAGQHTLDYIAILPAILIVLFGFLYIKRKQLEERRVDHD